MNPKQQRRNLRLLGSLLAIASICGATGAAAQQVNNAEDVFDWAEANFSALFPQPPEKGTVARYTYRFYPGSGWILAVQQGQVYGFHDAQTNRQMLPVTEAVCAINPALCTARGIAGRIYDTTFGRLTIESAANGRLTGRYTGTAGDGSDAGTVEGSLADDPSGGGQTFNGHWFANTAEQRCAASRNGTHYWGSAVLLFNREGTHFQGYWDFCDAGGAAEGAWHGDLVETRGLP